MPAKKKITGDDVRISKKPKTKKLARAVTTAKRSSVSKIVPMRAEKTKREWHLGMHLLIAGSAIGLLMLLGIVDRVTFSTLRSGASQSMPLTIGLEHKNPLTLSLVIARKSEIGYVSILSGSDEQIRISVPSTWKRIEVSGAPLSAFIQDIPVIGYTRWTLPPGAGIKMTLDNVPTALFFESPSESTTEIDLQTIDLDGSVGTEKRVILLKDKALARLWGSEEE